MIKLKQHRYQYFRRWALALGVLGITIYPIIISPMLDATPYKEIQKVTRKNIDQASIQPGNMRVWSDPFQRKKQETEK